MNEQNTDCCKCSCSNPDDKPWVSETINIAKRNIPVIRTTLSCNDYAGWWKVRWGIARERFTIPPGIYAVGTPDMNSNVFVTANYKMSFDHLRSSLTGENAFIMVLDTQGINVWCAAGKGTFGTEEVIKFINDTSLDKLVTHRNIILPQLGASGVSAHIVAKESGFKVIYGPVRAKDIPDFLSNDMKTTPEMRLVRFDIKDRLLLTPVEFVISAKYFLLGAIIATTLLIATGRSSIHQISPVLITIVTAWIAGAFLGPALLPALPGRSFSCKGIFAGLIASAAVAPLLYSGHISFLSWIAWTLIISSTASFMTMNFTGSSTYASPSGVRKEMKIFVPIQIIAAICGIGIWITSMFTG